MFLENKKILFDTYGILHCISVYLCDLGGNIVSVSCLPSVLVNIMISLSKFNVSMKILLTSLKQALSICLKALELSRAKIFDGGKPLTRKFLVLTRLQYMLASFLNSA